MWRQVCCRQTACQGSNYWHFSAAPAPIPHIFSLTSFAYLNKYLCKKKYFCESLHFSEEWSSWFPTKPLTVIIVSQVCSRKWKWKESLWCLFGQTQFLRQYRQIRERSWRLNMAQAMLRRSSTNTGYIEGRHFKH